MLTNGKLPDNFVDVVKCWPPSPNFLPVARCVTSDRFISKDLVLRYEDGEFGQNILVHTQEVDETDIKEYHFKDFAIDNVLFLLNTSRWTTRPYFIQWSWEYNPPLDFYKHAGRDFDEPTGENIVRSSGGWLDNYRMTFWHHSCIVSASEKAVLEGIFRASDFDPRIIRTDCHLNSCTLLVPKNVVSENPIGVFSAHEWHRFNKLGQRFLYAHLREALKQTWDPETKEKYMEKLHAQFERKRKIARFFTIEKQDLLDLKKDTFFGHQRDASEYWIIVDKEKKIEYVGNYARRIDESLNPQEQREIAELIIAEFDDTDSWQEQFTPFVREKVHPETARAIHNGRYFSNNGLNDKVKSRNENRSGLTSFDLESVWGWLSIVEFLIPNIFTQIREKAHGTPMTVDDYQRAFKSILQPILRIVMRASLSDLSQEENAESILAIQNIQFHPATKTCTYEFQEGRDIAARRERLKDDEAEWCPALFVPRMVEDLIEFYVRELYESYADQK